MKLLGLYRATAVILLNTALLAVIVVAVLSILLPAPEPKGRIYSKDFDLSSYSRISREEAVRVGHEFDRMGERRSYEFYPWTVFRERPFKGRLVNVLPSNTRATAAPSPKLPHQTDLTVWTFGGSTMFGWGMPDSQTIASHLQTVLQERLPERHVRVVNHGHSYYFSSMELGLLIALLREEPKPDVVALLDGLNDGAVLTWSLPVPFFSDVAYTAWDSERQKRYRLESEGPWFTVHDSFPPLRLLRRRTESRPGPGFRLPRKSRYRQQPEDPVAFALSHFEANRRMLHAVGEALGVETYQFLQPLRRLAAGERGAKEQRLLIAFYDALLEERPEGLHSIVDALEGLERPYVDPTHYSDEGSYRVALAMAEIILKDQTAAASPD